MVGMTLKNRNPYFQSNLQMLELSLVQEAQSPKRLLYILLSVNPRKIYF
jgi:hypothetical protein